IPAKGKDHPENIFGTIVNLIEDVSEGHTIDGISFGVNAPAGPDMDVLFLMENLPALEDFPLKPRLTEHFGIPVLLENDANCMAVGEHIAGALTGCNNCICITLGTGLGCGIIIDGSIYRGSHYCSGEIWNIPAGKGRTLEDTVSIEGLKGIYRELSGCELEPDEIYKKYLDGDTVSVETFERYGEAVGNVMVAVLSFLDPEKIAVGGGIAKSFQAFWNGMTGVVEKSWGTDAAGKIVPAKLSNKAAIIGAAALFESSMRN
ncbi:ROK family protein, partial [Candidatus Latescibacterota bacterium]